MKLIKKGIIMDWVISSVWSSQVITALQPVHLYNALLLLFTPPAMVSPFTSSYYLLRLLTPTVCFYWLKQNTGPFSVVFIIWRMGVWYNCILLLVNLIILLLLFTKNIAKSTTLLIIIKFSKRLIECWIFSGESILCSYGIRQ